MPKRIVTALLAMLGTIATTFASLAQGANFAYFYIPVSLNGVAGNTAVYTGDGGAGIPPDRTVCFSFGWPNMFGQAIPWTAGGFTGFFPPSPVTTYQAGLDANWYGAPTCQIQGTSMGFHINSAGPFNTSSNSYYGMQLAYVWSNPGYRPWSYGSAAKLRAQTFWALGPQGTQGTGSSVQYGYVYVGLRDIPTGHTIFYTIATWDSRGSQAPGEFVDVDPTLPGNYLVYTYPGTGTRLSTPHPQSHYRNGGGSCAVGCDWYAAYITKANLLNAINDLNAQKQAGFTSCSVANPSCLNNYLLTLVGSGTEMASATGNGWVGSRIHDVWVLTTERLCWRPPRSRRYPSRVPTPTSFQQRIRQTRDDLFARPVA